MSLAEKLTYTVKWGDTLSGIADKQVTASGIEEYAPSYYKDTYQSNNSKYGYLEAKIRYLLYMNPDITNRDLIYVKQVILLYGPNAKATTSRSSRATITAFGLMANTDNTIFATWAWSLPYTEKYQISWEYKVSGSTSWYPGDSRAISVDAEDPDASRFSTYQMPTNAVAVSFRVKPIAYTREASSSSDKGAAYWSAVWSTRKTYTDWANIMPDPSVPDLEIDKQNKYHLTVSVDNVDEKVAKVQFQLCKNNTEFAGASPVLTLAKGYASYNHMIELGAVYKVRCRYYDDKANTYGEWSQWSSNIQTYPSRPAEITHIKANTWTTTEKKYSISLAWSAVNSATSYDIQYTTNEKAFEGNTDDTTTISNITTTQYETFNLEAGHEYFFRVRATNSGGSSDWSNYKSVVLGNPPSAPTTWSSTITAVVGDPLVLYWVHNAEDGSSETFAQLEVYVNDVLTIQDEIKNVLTEETTKSYNIDTTEYEDGASLSWRVRTAGVTKTLGDWSITRTITINAPPTMELDLTDNNGESTRIVTGYPFKISALAGPSTQAPIGYYLSIISNSSYDTVDDVGNTETVGEGDTIYSQYFDIITDLNVSFYPMTVRLENNESYTVVCTAAMDSGLRSEASLEFTVALGEPIGIEPNAEIGLEKNSYSAYIRPYCEDLEGNLITGDVRLSVYRRELDGTFTAIAEDLDNAKGAYIVDPHPSLDYARYRVVATKTTNGDSEYFDLPAQEIGCKAIIIQWNEDWKDNFYDSGEGLITDDIWSGSMLKFPYNIDISDTYDVDVSMVEYAGRQHPVTYYGTQVGESSTYSADIEKDDIETLTGLRRLAKWPGDVYVRVPSGVGYWANVKVSHSTKHCNKAIPVTIEVTRVEGGM